jgi:hypothetical protein
MLATVCGYSPLVEIGAGNGYNDWLLQQMGAEVVAFDAFPVEASYNPGQKLDHDFKGRQLCAQGLSRSHASHGLAAQKPNGVVIAI